MAAAGVAQLVEQLICNQQVISSSLIAGSRIPHKSTLVRVAVTAAEAVRPLHMRKRPRSGIIEPKRRLLSGHRAPNGRCRVAGPEPQRSESVCLAGAPAEPQQSEAGEHQSEQRRVGDRRGGNVAVSQEPDVPLIGALIPLVSTLEIDT